jgi:O-antigen/teichoic acid export membrane protein
MKGKLIQNLSANTLQLVVNQLFGLVIFFILSTSLDKDIFGRVNLALAILLAVFNILSFGIDQIVVRKIASGDDPRALLSVYLAHVILTGVLFYAALLLLNSFMPQLFGAYKLLLFIGCGKLMIFFSTPFKQFTAGFEQFKLLARMSVISNIIRGIALLVLALLHSVTLNYVVLIFIGGDLAELIWSVILFKYKLKIPIAISWNKEKYIRLIKESFPQVGVVVFTSALARFDWIFIGLMVSAVKLAEYSFAYKVFEMSTLPLLALAPLLVPRFTQLFKNKEVRTTDMRLLLRVEMIVAAFIALILCLSWSPLIDAITNHKYGMVNLKTVFILSLCMPLLYLNNFLWSVSFAQGRLKMILGVITLTFVINLAGDVLLIPILKNEGAALAYLAAMLIQCVAYIKKNDVEGLNTCWQPLLYCTLCALLSGFIAEKIFSNIWLVPISAISIYVAILFVTQQFRISDWKNITRILS